jgi:hypothetical protein
MIDHTIVAINRYIRLLSSTRHLSGVVHKLVIHIAVVQAGHVALLLYSIARKAKPRIVIEYGSGYTTLFVLAALADNASAQKEEYKGLVAKTKCAAERGSVDSDRELVERWYSAGGKAAGVDPGYYVRYQEPHLHVFEELAKDSDHAFLVRRAISDLGLQHYATYHAGKRLCADTVTADIEVVDLAWNDYGFICWTTSQRRAAGDLEVLTIPEPHKLNQNSCTILRRVTNYTPQRQDEARIRADARSVLAKTRSR